MPKDLDASLGLTLDDDDAREYRALLYVNGWNLGQYANDVGPQHTFVLPNGILNPHGKNTLAIAVTSRQQGGATGGGLGTVKLTDLGTSRGGAGLDLVHSPGYAAPRLTPKPVPPNHDPGTPVTVADVTVPPDAQGTSFAATSTGATAPPRPAPSPAAASTAASWAATTTRARSTGRSGHPVRPLRLGPGNR